MVSTRSPDSFYRKQLGVFLFVFLIELLVSISRLCHEQPYDQPILPEAISLSVLIV